KERADGAEQGDDGPGDELGKEAAVAAPAIERHGLAVEHRDRVSRHRDRLRGQRWAERITLTLQAERSIDGRDWRVGRRSAAPLDGPRRHQRVLDGADGAVLRYADEPGVVERDPLDER